MPSRPVFSHGPAPWTSPGRWEALLDRSLELDLDTALEWEALAQGLLIDSADHREGLAAFFERRPPRFTGA